ncbi:MAG: T9SS type A sorting domain-containing protein, partial [Salegentibacter sp.]
DGAGNIHFMNAADPDVQNDTAATTGDPTEITFTAKVAGTYIIYDDVDKPSYFRIMRKSATYAEVTGNVDLTNADGIPSDYNIVFTNDTGKTWSSSVSGGSYSVNLPMGYQYDISLEGADGYSLAGSTTLEVTESTSTNDIAIIKDGASLEGLPDVWDFGATQLDESQYNNMLTVDVINSWYDPSITPGSSGNLLPDFTAGDLSWTGGGNDRLRTVNTELTRYDDNIDDYEDFKGRVYVNSRGAADRFFSIELKEDDKVSLWVLGQDGNGEIHFEYVANPELQNDVAETGGEMKQVNFVAKANGIYHIYDGADKPSYFRIIRKPATYANVSGNVDLTDAPGILADYSLVFSIEEGKTWSVTPTDGKYQVDLPTGFDYSISVAGADGYVISNGATLNVTGSTTDHDIAIKKVEIYSVTGSIQGLGDKIGDLDLTFTPNSAEAVYVPKPVIDSDAATYTVKLEPNINYAISGGVDGYYIPDNHVEITGETTHDIVFEAEPEGPYGDIDEDGILNADDNCMYTPNPDQADSNENGIGDVCEDDDGDGIINYDDNCPDTPEGAVVDVFGCEVLNLTADNYSVTVHDVSCNGNSDGFISISAADTAYTYNVSVSGTDSASATLSSSNDFSADIENLKAGNYNICITVDGHDNYEQCFNVTLEGPTPLEAFSSVNYGTNTVSFSLSGAKAYSIEHNGKVTTTTRSQVVMDLDKGKNKFTIYTDSDCQGKVYKEVLLSDEVVAFPNPTQGDLKVYINGEDAQVDVSLINFNGTKFISRKMEVPADRVLHLDLSNLIDGVYFLQLKSATVSKSIKVIKS